MRCALPTVLGLLTLAAPLASQAKPGHVYGISYYQALPGKGAAYNKALTEVVFPVLDEMVKRKTLVSYLSLNQVAGSGEYSHAFLLEFSDWAAFGTYEAKRNEATQAVHHKAWSEAIAGFPDLRRAIRSETYQPVGQ